MALFTVENLSFTYPGQTAPAIDRLTLTVPEGAFLVLCGPSGCGKSTLLRQLKPALAPHGVRQGRILFRDAPLEQVLAGYLGLDRVQLIRCGGSSQIAAEREQWNDGSNTLCIAPGVVVVYDRNYVTNQILEDSGIRVLKMPSAELSRGRGGPRCMSMPLIRDDP